MYSNERIIPFTPNYIMLCWHFYRPPKIIPTKSTQNEWPIFQFFNVKNHDKKKKSNKLSPYCRICIVYIKYHISQHPALRNLFLWFVNNKIKKHFSCVSNIFNSLFVFQSVFGIMKLQKYLEQIDSINLFIISLLSHLKKNKKCQHLDKSSGHFIGVI